MPWAMNPIFGSKSVPGNAVVDVEIAQADDRSGGGSASPEPKDGHSPKLRPPSDRLSRHQIFYIFGVNGVGAAIVAGGINFAIAYALYHDKDTLTSPIRLFQFPNTLAGDTAVTIFIQFLTTWVIQSLLVNFDLRKGGVQPIGFLKEPRWQYLRWFMFLDRQEQTLKVRSFTHWLIFLVSQAIRGLILAVIFFPVIFGVSVGLLTLVGAYEDGDWYFSPMWAPQIFKLVQGALLGLLFTPPMAAFWLVRCGWAQQNREGQSSR
ncbi:hypothetical protein F5B22DRAFT_489708 [Xylaria bambusicola]|uniref:uncharacterized protein n=1 Tax=Xylaria bambusicola TaxID=326684 RepID=UPI0020076AAD|nr:uncharacterized protein F5B22DRAFT_489708 [Xylaria bambusicola]KAI0505849.1 hypothetical protein F5B22DRAFT_489708 [Xylaria bambusicola]